MKIIKNIGAIVGARQASSGEALRGESMNSLPIVRDAWLAIDGQVFHSFGSMSSCPLIDCETVDAHGSWLFPSFCDSHTHLVYAGSREQEFVDKINGLGYAEIAARGGGILNSADRLHDTPADELYRQSAARVREIILSGTAAIEIKSGYGLTLDDELKMLRVIARIKESFPIEVKATFLGAHAVGRAFTGRQQDYVDHVCEVMIPAVAAEQLADYVDVFCEQGFFTVAQTIKVLDAASRYGIKPRLHANQLHRSGGVQVGVAHNALSVDHLENIGREEIAILAGAPTIATVLPGASFFLNMEHASARQLIEAGAAVAIASDYNPGTSPSGDMRFMASLGCIQLRLTPEQALNAATLNGAAALELAHKLGSVTPGKTASFFLTAPLPSPAYLLYAYTAPLIQSIYLRGNEYPA
ncbi:MAG: imidazolonepropionase [Clostridiales bacterium]|nr:imidazolonepropionase [Clostridiales bacterium]